MQGQTLARGVSGWNSALGSKQAFLFGFDHRRYWPIAEVRRHQDVLQFSPLISDAETKWSMLGAYTPQGLKRHGSESRQTWLRSP